MTHPVPDVALDSRLAIVGTSGSGKTYAAKGMVEDLLSLQHRVVIVDPLDVWFGLRLLKSGKGKAFPVAILGGRHADLPLTEHSGALIGEAVARSTESCIVSLNGLKSSAARQRFMLAFLDALYERTDPDARDPYHVIFDEADLWAPQKPMGQEAMLAHLMEEIVRRGRVKGFIPWLITQRPAVLNKNVLSQADGLIAMKLTASQDRKALGAWVQSTADEGQWNDIDKQLPTFAQGQGVVWLPGHGILKVTRFPENDTFDSSRTPKRGEKKHDTELAPLDLGALKSKLASIEQEASANDPKKLKGEIARLEAELAKKPAVQTQISERVVIQSDDAALAAARNEGMRLGRMAQLEEVIRDLRLSDRALDKSFDALATSVDTLRRSSASIGVWLATAEEKLTTLQQSAPPRQTTPLPPAPTRPATSSVARASMPSPAAGGDGSLGSGERAVLAVIASSRDGVRPEQITVVTGYKKSSRNTYLQRLSAKSYTAKNGDRLIITAAGIAALGFDYEPPPTGAALREQVMGRLGEGERRILDALIRQYPAPLTHETIDEITGYKKSSRNTYLQRLSARELLDESCPRGSSKAADRLFQ